MAKIEIDYEELKKGIRFTNVTYHREFLIQYLKPNGFFERLLKGRRHRANFDKIYENLRSLIRSVDSSKDLCLNSEVILETPTPLVSVAKKDENIYVDIEHIICVSGAYPRKFDFTLKEAESIPEVRNKINLAQCTFDADSRRLEGKVREYAKDFPVKISKMDKYFWDYTRI